MSEATATSNGSRIGIGYGTLIAKGGFLSQSLETFQTEIKSKLQKKSRETFYLWPSFTHWKGVNPYIIDMLYTDSIIGFFD